jgi:hypothetical protein
LETNGLLAIRQENPLSGTAGGFMRIRYSSLALAFAIFLFSCSLLNGQAVSGTILGTVTDATGAAVAKAQVTILLTGQSAVHTSITNESGNFTEPDLPSGTYTVTVAAPGFKTETRENIVLLTNTTARVDVNLATAADRPRRHLNQPGAAPDFQSSPEQREQLSIPAQCRTGDGAGSLQ